MDRLMNIGIWKHAFHTNLNFFVFIHIWPNNSESVFQQVISLIFWVNKIFMYLFHSVVFAKLMYQYLQN